MPYTSVSIILYSFVPKVQCTVFLKYYIISRLKMYLLVISLFTNEHQKAHQLILLYIICKD